MSLGNINAGALHSDKESSQRLIKATMEFIMDNIEFLDNVRNGKKYREDAISLNKQDYPFTSNQLSYIDNIYEKVMKGMGFPSYQSTYKPKRRCV